MSPLFFFLMIRRPPRSTLFPTRRSSDLARRQSGDAVPVGPPRPAGERGLVLGVVRSEEHTSELQSRLHLVCRLLLEKKKKKKKSILYNHHIESIQSLSVSTVYSMSVPVR